MLYVHFQCCRSQSLFFVLVCQNSSIMLDSIRDIWVEIALGALHRRQKVAVVDTTPFRVHIPFVTLVVSERTLHILTWRLNVLLFKHICLLADWNWLFALSVHSNDVSPIWHRWRLVGDGLTTLKWLCCVETALCLLHDWGVKVRSYKGTPRITKLFGFACVKLLLSSEWGRLRHWV